MDHHKIYPLAIMLLFATLACSLRDAAEEVLTQPPSQEPTTVFVTATNEPVPTEAEPTAPADSNISTEPNIKNDSQSFSDAISYPNGDTKDQVSVRAVGFDSITTSGDMTYTLTCSGKGVGSVQVFGGGPCNNTWTDFYTDGSYQETIRISLQSGGNAYVSWTLVIPANS